MSRRQATNSWSRSQPTGNCILVGRDPWTGIDPVWIAAEGDRPRENARYSGKLGPGTFVRSFSNTSEPCPYYIPNIAFFRRHTVSNIKRLLHESGPDERLRFGEVDRELWETPQGNDHVYDLLITWLANGEDLEPPGIWACPFPSIHLSPNDLPYDKVPAFHLSSLNQAVHLMVTNCRRDMEDCYSHITFEQFHYYMLLWAHYKMHPSEHTVFGKVSNADDTPPLRQFIIHVPHVMDFAESVGASFFPHMALATKRWSTIFGTHHIPVANNDPFTLLANHLTGRLLPGQPSQVSGYLLPGDLIGTQNDKFYNAGHPNDFGGNDHASTVRETVIALGDVRRLLRLNAPLVDRDINSSEERVYMPVELVNAWRRRTRTAAGPSEPGRPPPHVNRPPPHVNRPLPHVNRLFPHLRPPPPHVNRPGPPAAQPHHPPARRITSETLFPVHQRHNPDRADRGLPGQAAIRWDRENQPDEEWGNSDDDIPRAAPPPSDPWLPDPQPDLREPDPPPILWDVDPNRPIGTPMTEELFEALPRLRTGVGSLWTISKGHECCICSEDMPLNTEQVVLECGHWGHTHCMKNWLVGENEKCPICRHVTRHPPSEHDAAWAVSSSHQPFQPILPELNSPAISSELATELHKHLDQMIEEVMKDGATAQQMSRDTLYLVQVMKKTLKKNTPKEDS
ncbi:hypothetical protein EV127DRAFT_487222 [Xylaria flabelliformis]|nr:hypothetical protein EV127DRAFT_487222 [Xylaria flabelliformis]